MEGDAFCLQDLFRFRQTSVNTDGHAVGHFEACGVRPQLLERIHSEGVELPQEMFRQRVLAPVGAGAGAAAAGPAVARAR